MIRRLLPLVGFLALALLLFAGVRMNSGRDNSAIESPLIGKPVPSFTLPVLGEPARMVSNAELLGRPYLLNVWGSWCVNCRDEHPQLMDLARSGKFRVLGYNYKDVPGDARRWLEEYGNPYSLVIADEEGRAALEWGIYGAPETFLVDARGIIRWKHVGPLSTEMIREQVEPMLISMEADR